VRALPRDGGAVAAGSEPREMALTLDDKLSRNYRLAHGN